jgi:hypothetical protein
MNTPDHPVDHPIVCPDDDGEARHWRRLSIGEHVKGYDQCYAFAPKVGWRLSSFHTSERLVHDGRSTYRRPRSLRAWATVALPFARKLWRRFWDGQV